MALILLVIGSSVCARTHAESFDSRALSLGRGQPAVLYEPSTGGSKSSIGVLVMHDNEDYLRPFPGNPCLQIAQRGFRVLCTNASTSKSGFFSDDDIDRLLLNVKAGVVYLRQMPQVERVVLFGHSGGGEMMAAYQNIAENGVAACQGSERLIRCPDTLAAMPAADGVMLIDSVLGGPVSTLISLDPAVTDEAGGRNLARDLDMYDPRNGFEPRGSRYGDAFRRRFFAAEAGRMNRLIDSAVARLKAIEAGQGLFEDDEPFVVPGAMGAQNKLNSLDMSLMARTRQSWPLLHGDGTVSTEVIRSVRVPRNPMSSTPSLAHGALTTTVRRFLSTWAVRTTAAWGYGSDSIGGFDAKSSYANEIDSIAGISKPLLQMGMTGSYEYFFAETVRGHARSADKTLVYVEGALHDFTPCTECAVAQGRPPDAYGDTVKTLFDYIERWLARPGRFVAQPAP